MNERILELHSQMRMHTLKAGVNEKFYDKLIHGLDKKKQATKAKLLLFLEEVMEGEYAAVMGVWNLPHINDEMWEMYENLGHNDLPEQKTLKQARKILRKKWRTYNAQKKINKISDKQSSKRS